eukprot:c8925_g1_i1.p1 GENE.c8925_g1_i1~~c8925_g1_i1.p1  ORF type:complete len:237 (+),score=42.70 c8925_g1_i1:64-774(+)
MLNLARTFGLLCACLLTTHAELRVDFGHNNNVNLNNVNNVNNVNTFHQLSSLEYDVNQLLSNAKTFEEDEFAKQTNPDVLRSVECQHHNQPIGVPNRLPALSGRGNSLPEDGEAKHNWNDAIEMVRGDNYDGVGTIGNSGLWKGYRADVQAVYDGFANIQIQRNFTPRGTASTVACCHIPIFQIANEKERKDAQLKELTRVIRQCLYRSRDSLENTDDRGTARTLICFDVIGELSN